jgi:hypothetical protein
MHGRSIKPGSIHAGTVQTVHQSITGKGGVGSADLYSKHVLLLEKN